MRVSRSYGQPPSGAVCVTTPAGRRLVPGRRAILVPPVGVLVALPTVPAEVPATCGFPAGSAAEREAADLLAAPGTPEVPGGVLRHRRGVAHDAQLALIGGGQRRAGYQVGLRYPSRQAGVRLIAQDRRGDPFGGPPAVVGGVAPVELGRVVEVPGEPGRPGLRAFAEDRTSLRPVANSSEGVAESMPDRKRRRCSASRYSHVT